MKYEINPHVREDNVLYFCIMLIDTHAHLNLDDFKDDADKVIKRALDISADSPSVWIINVGIDYSTSKKAVEIAEKYSEGVYATVGIHPIHAKRDVWRGSIPPSIRELTESKKIVAIGEIGLDYKPEYIFFKEQQREIFLKQIDLAKELNLPIIFHCRMAHNDLIEILKSQIQNLKLRGVVHCFTGNWKEAEKYLDMDFYLGFNGIIFKFNLDKVIKKTPLDKFLLETDCPYLTPPQIKGRNEPIYIKHIAKKIAQIKKINYQEVIDITTQNAKKLFNI